jgi:hypothetical protein
VEKGLGHGSRDMLEEVYGRLGDVRHRSGAVEYRVEQHFDWVDGEWAAKGRRPAPLILDGLAVLGQASRVRSQ